MHIHTLHVSVPTGTTPERGGGESEEDNSSKEETVVYTMFSVYVRANNADESRWINRQRKDSIAWFSQRLA